MVWKATKASGKSPFPASGHSITARDKQVYVFAGNTNKTTHANLFILNTGLHIPPPPLTLFGIEHVHFVSRSLAGGTLRV